MKINVDIDITPEEARRFLGLPDLEPMQQAVLQDLQDRLQKNIDLLEPEALLKTWFSLAPQGMEQLSKMFGGLAGMGSRSGRKGDASKKD